MKRLMSMNKQIQSRRSTFYNEQNDFAEEDQIVLPYYADKVKPVVVASYEKGKCLKNIFDQYDYSLDY